jgi:aldose 1-epimerase
LSRDIVKLTDGAAEAVVIPSLGAGLASYDLLAGGRPQALFRRCSDIDGAGPFDLANNLLVPWSNRVSGGGFQFRNRFHPLEPNLAGEPCPIHGNGFAAAWAVIKSARELAVLELRSIGPGPFEYHAKATYRLAGEGRLSMALDVTNLGQPLPFGLGFHPWLPRTPRTFLRAKAQTVTLQDERYLPASKVAVATRPDWDFSAPRSLPDRWINNEFDGWAGQAWVEWRDRGLSLAIAASGTARYIVYSPARDAGFFCLEPVSHAIDAFNVPDGPEANGLIILERGQSMSISCDFTPQLM